VAARWVLRPDGIASFTVGPYDPSRSLVIDPVLSYSSYLGGSGADSANALATDAAGNIYVAGSTASANFPATSGAARTVFAGGTDVFVAKFDPTGNTRIWATFLGGALADTGAGVAIDGSGSVYVTGETTSVDFPATAGTLRATYAGGGSDAFVTKLAPSGAALVYSTFLGGTGEDGVRRSPSTRAGTPTSPGDSARRISPRRWAPSRPSSMAVPSTPSRRSSRPEETPSSGRLTSAAATTTRASGSPSAPPARPSSWAAHARPTFP